ncbi:hypothetical protein BCR24_09445 [Enterococcus ureilyticus]|uniref:Peptidase C51 domain-containing protein n=1 Tax=Enterococcus ureilyticus TaxID=1131292 RepID=A0A1E5H590_9ENTE|nr:CHAP domain-containing protein [Enterococcus ureilyticus]MBM7689068.1 uncharacterized protein YjdB [Enterococcus ureilyticus]OEG20137.1 hypothetical protein BCR24_09445 [Enterococcus ureilyticus]
MAVEGSILISGSQWLQGQGVHVYSNGGNYGTYYQCVELPQQRLYPKMGWPRVYAAGNGGAQYIPEGSPGLARYNPGSKYIPVPGDLIIETGNSSNPYGHVSVVDYTDVDKGIIYAVEQNASASGRMTYTYNGSNYTGLSSNRTVKCILHAPGNNFKNPSTAPKLPSKNPAQPISKGINYETHVSKVGWMNNVKDGALSGSTGFKLPVEAVKITFKNGQINGSVEYRAHVSEKGWMSWVKSGQVAGTTGQSKAVEAIQARLTGEAANYYNLEYQAYVDGNGWLSWVNNGATAGTTGQKKTLQAIKMKLVRKPIVQGSKQPTAKGLSYRMHLAEEGWLGYVTENQMAGTTGLGIESQCLEVYMDGKKENIQIDAHVAEKGWLTNAGGTVGQRLSLQAVKINLKNGLDKYYDIYYQVHVSEKGWMPWVKNGAIAGTTGQKLAIQAIRIKLDGKITKEPVNTVSK